MLQITICDGIIHCHKNINFDAIAGNRFCNFALSVLHIHIVQKCLQYFETLAGYQGEDLFSSDNNIDPDLDSSSLGTNFMHLLKESKILSAFIRPRR